MRSPSAPTATAARESGRTLWRLPVPWDGSTKIGRWLRFLTAGTTARASVLREKSENGLFGAARAFEQGKILHVARADLDDVGVFFDEVEAFVVDGFGDDAEAKLFADLHENFQAGFAETLEAVRGSAGLVSAAAKEPRAGFLDALS